MWCERLRPLRVSGGEGREGERERAAGGDVPGSIEFEKVRFNVMTGAPDLLTEVEVFVDHVWDKRQRRLCKQDRVVEAAFGAHDAVDAGGIEACLHVLVEEDVAVGDDGDGERVPRHDGGEEMWEGRWGEGGGRT